MTKNVFVEEGVERLRTRWPQSHSVEGWQGHHLIVVPSVILPKAYDKNICTVLFVVLPGFPAARPDHFFTDIEIRLANKRFPHCVNMGNGDYLAHLGWPQWAKSMWWSWHLQMWNPNHSNLYTYMQVIKQRFNCGY